MLSSILFAAIQHSRIKFRQYRSYGINIITYSRTKKDRRWCSTANTKKGNPVLVAKTRLSSWQKRLIMWGHSSKIMSSKSRTITFRDVASRCWTKKDRLKQIKTDLLE